MRNASAAKKEGNGIKKRKSKQERRFFLLGLLFVSPWLIGFLCFQLYPILSALYYSFTDFNIFQPAEFTGLDNYVTLFNDKYFPVSIKNTAVMSFIGMPIGLVVALALAVLLSKEVKGMPAFRTIYYLPTVVPIVASAMLFLWVGGSLSALYFFAIFLEIYTKVLTIYRKRYIIKSWKGDKNK